MYGFELIIKWYKINFLVAPSLFRRGGLGGEVKTMKNREDTEHRVPESKGARALDLDICEKCRHRLSSYGIKQADGTMILLCHVCYYAKGTEQREQLS